MSLLCRRGQFTFLMVWIGAATFAPSTLAQQVESTEANLVVARTENRMLRFSFDNTPWRDVIQWIAEESDLALHVGDLPTGSFTYSDSSAFSPSEAIDRANLFLLPQGFTLVRSGKLLSVINLGDPRSMQQLDALAKLVTVDELDQQDNHDVVKCIFPLGELQAEDAIQELSALNLMTTPAVFEKTKRLLIVDSVSKLKNVKSILEAFQPETMDNGTVVKSFALQHVDAEDVLVVARPHLGLATGEMIGIDVSLSADLQGKNIFVTGVEDKVKLIEGLVTAIDQPQEKLLSAMSETELRSHVVEGGNVETVYNVLQTLLAGKTIRLSMDEASGSIVALATPEVQAEIAQTVQQLRASDADFEVITLKWVDPYFAISLIEEMLDLPDSLTDPELIDPSAPKIDADPANMRLFVRAKQHQIEEIKKIVEELDVSTSVESGGEFRLLPIKGKQAERVLTTAAKFWRGANPVILYRSTEATEPDDVERVVHHQRSDVPATANGATANGATANGATANGATANGATRMTLTAAASNSPNLGDAKYLSGSPRSSAVAIQCQLTLRGLLLQSADTSALDQFEQQLRAIAGPLDSMPSPPIVFYLAYTKVDDAIRMLAELLDGGEAAEEGKTGSLVNGFVSSGSGAFLSSIVTSRDGTMTMMAGNVTIVADSRLNRLIAQGSATDMERIESYLEIIDKDSSITSVKTYGTSRVIELVNTKASEVAAAIREAYAGRVTAASSGKGGPNPSGSAEQGKRDASAQKRSDESQKEGGKKAAKQSAGQPPRNLEPKMTVAVHEPSNSLIVTAPEQLFEEVEQLARVLDLRGEETIEIITPLNAVAMESMLRQLILGEPATSKASSKPSPSTSQSSQRSGSPSASKSRGKSGR